MKNKRTSLASCSPEFLYRYGNQKAKKAATPINFNKKQQLCKCIALSVYMFTVYAQLQREMIKSYKVLLRT